MTEPDYDSDIEIISVHSDSGSRTPRVEYTPDPPTPPPKPQPDPDYFTKRGLDDPRYTTQHGFTTGQLSWEQPNGEVKVYNPRQKYFGYTRRNKRPQMARASIPFRILENSSDSEPEETDPHTYCPLPPNISTSPTRDSLHLTDVKLCPADQLRAYQIEAAFKHSIALEAEQATGEPPKKKKAPLRNPFAHQLSDFEEFLARNPGAPRTVVPDSNPNKDPFPPRNTALYPPILLTQVDIELADLRDANLEGPKVPTQQRQDPYYLQPTVLRPAYTPRLNRTDSPTPGPSNASASVPTASPPQPNPSQLPDVITIDDEDTPTGQRPPPQAHNLAPLVRTRRFGPTQPAPSTSTHSSAAPTRDPPPPASQPPRQRPRITPPQASPPPTRTINTSAAASRWQNIPTRSLQDHIRDSRRAPQPTTRRANDISLWPVPRSQSSPATNPWADQPDSIQVPDLNQFIANRRAERREKQSQKACNGCPTQ